MYIIVYTSSVRLNAVSVRAARATISALLDAAERGESTLVIRNSKPSAVIAPLAASPSRGEDDDVRWYRVPGVARKIGFAGAANTAFLHQPREERARILEVLATLATDGDVVIKGS